MMTNKEQFEAWVTRHDVNTMRTTVGDAYMTNAAYITWEAWQARGKVDAKRIAELEARNKELVDALEGVTDSLGGNYEQHAIRKRIQDLLGEVK